MHFRTVREVDGKEVQALGIDAALTALDHGASDADVVALLEQSCTAFVSEDRIHRLAPHARRLRGLDFGEHPRAALPAGVAICTIDRPLGRAILAGGREHLESAGDPGVGLAWFLEGLEDLGEGKLEQASAWWRQALGSLDPGLPATRMILAHLALGAYERGELPEAITLAEEALWSAERAGDARTEALAALYLGFFHLYTGRFSNCDHLTDRADQAMLLVADEDRYELPLVDIERGALAAVRGDHERSEQCFDRAFDLARMQGNDWYLAIGLTIRADLTGRLHPTRSVADARAALEFLDPIGEGWWSRWARLALAVAHLHAGNHHAGRQTCTALLALDLNPLERGRTLLVLADLLHAAGDRCGSEHAARESLGLLTDAKADFLGCACGVGAGSIVEKQQRGASPPGPSDGRDRRRGPGVGQVAAGARRVADQRAGRCVGAHRWRGRPIQHEGRGRTDRHVGVCRWSGADVGDR